MANPNRIRKIPLRDLLLDKENPRFGGNTGKSDSQKSLLETIVDKYGVNDLLVSMATNGYFSPEPVVAVKHDNGQFIVVEGNRRVTAALILTSDPRASQYADIARRWNLDENRGKIASLRELPVSVFEKRNEELIAYLGAKHIRGSKPWDSYAKAHWLFELMSVTEMELTIERAAQLVGDQNPNTVKRILEAYILMKQLRDEMHYKSESSQVGGRGSNTDYPFSWVYTSIGYENIRNWIEISGLESQNTIQATTKVLKSKKALENSEKLIMFLFGSNSKPARPVVSESRQIRLLNEVVENKISIKELEHETNLQTVWENLRPVTEQLESLFYKTQKNLEIINTLIAGEVLQSEELQQVILTGQKCKNLINTVVATLNSRFEDLS